ncbi:sideroflexin-4-like isoform X1 [Sphaeramia orbicularis]|uniref:sideroflexin-4-like isoform X1 n=1 Tax=Sphaeramia orbicularis TaxID=375764 RepID=UPI0011815F11|nr:sideroflexin-4-like isoform X1 [Sphaeramia orbicularis]
MDPNLVFWKNEGQSFFSRFRIWFNILDPLSQLSTDDEILKARARLKSEDKQSEQDALNLSLVSVHADSGAILPLLFRPPVFWPISAPLVYASFLPFNSVKPALFYQFLLQSYNTGFNYANRNSSSEQKKRMSLNQLLLIAGTISYTTCAGALPQIIINRLHVKSVPVQTFCRSILPIPLAAVLAFFNVMTVRSQEPDNGIQVFDSNGNSVGFSKAAGEKAVRETAVSRAALMGTAAAVPNLLVLFLHRLRFVQRNVILAASVRPVSVTLILSLMIPVSFSLFPQLAAIKKEELEAELQAAAVDGHLLYHRGL